MSGRSSEAIQRKRDRRIVAKQRKLAMTHAKGVGNRFYTEGGGTELLVEGGEYSASRFADQAIEDGSTYPDLSEEVAEVSTAWEDRRRSQGPASPVHSGR